MKFEVSVSRAYLHVDVLDMTINAKDLARARAIAMIRAKHNVNLNWKDRTEEDYNFQIEDITPIQSDLSRLETQNKDALPNHTTIEKNNPTNKKTPPQYEKS